jgi:hypothetical protein
LTDTDRHDRALVPRSCQPPPHTDDREGECGKRCAKPNSEEKEDGFADRCELLLDRGHRHLGLQLLYISGDVVRSDKRWHQTAVFAPGEKTPMQTFLDALPLAKEKLMAA